MRTLYIALFSLLLLTAAGSPVEPALSDEANAFLQRGTKEYQDAHYQDALRDFSQAAKLSNDTCERCVEGLALSKAHLGDQKESLKLADKAISMAANPTDQANAHDCKGEICLIYASADPKKLAMAETEFRASAVLLPNRASDQFRLGYVLLRENKDEEGIQHLQAYLAADPAGVNADLAHKLIAKPRLAGQQLAPQFSFKSAQGNTIDNASLEGKIVVLDFWATWCPPCRESVPELKELTKKYGADKLRVISISADEKETDWRDFIAHKQMDWDQYRDADESVRKAFGVRAFPTYVLLNKDGAIAKRMEGLNPQDSLIHRLRDELNTLMK
jgi:thiol-disulfide isomerase/thioredoxin